MPAFAAINVEPEENVEDEIDTTREIHVDEALKLYQTALKHHAQGPKSYDDAAAAYDALFRSDIFQYPEASTEYERAERQPEPVSAVEPGLLAPLEVVQPAEGDSSASSLPQAFYLAFKNYGQFKLDRIRHRVKTAASPRGAVFGREDVLQDAHGALNDFNAALDRDPSDAELWRRTARVAAFLKSTRINRYCLEAAIELDDDPAVDEVDPPSLAEGFAGEQLRGQLEVLSDNMALSHPVMAPFLRKLLPSALEKYVDPIPYLPNAATTLAAAGPRPEPAGAQRTVVEVATRSWADLGFALVQYFVEQGYSSGALFVELPEAAEEPEDVQMQIDQQLRSAEEQEEKAVPTADPSREKEEDEDEEEEPAREQVAAAQKVLNPKEASAGQEAAREQNVSLPSRKRSQSVAGMADAADEESEQKRSKRTRRRDTAPAEGLTDPGALLATQLQPYQGADQNLFQSTKNIIENLGVSDCGTLDRIGEILDSCAVEDRTAKISSLAAHDLRRCLVAYDEDTARILLNKKETPAVSLSTFLEHSKSSSLTSAELPAFDEALGLQAFAARINDGWLTIHDVAFEWTLAVSGSYGGFAWSDQLKTAVVQMASRLDAEIYNRALYELRDLGRPGGPASVPADLDDMIQMLFELYLDVYQRITNPNSVVEYAVRAETKEKLGRWLDLAASASRVRPAGSGMALTLRFLWAAVFSTTLGESISRDHTLACWRSLRDHLAACEYPTIWLPNNAVMSEISAAAADGEISKLTTMDFFLGIFQEEMRDPLQVIETLEPVLNPDSVYVEVPDGAQDGGAKDGPRTAPRSDEKAVLVTERASQGLIDLWNYLKASGTDLRLFLWSKLANAWGAVEYTTKQFSCHLRSIEMIVADLERDSYAHTTIEARRVLLMQTLKSLDDLLIQSLSLALNDNTAFDIIDEEHIRSTSAALAKLSCLLHAAAIFDDEVRLGMVREPPRGATFASFANKFREMQVRTWSLQYTVFKVAIHQDQAVFSKPENELADYLAAIHQVVGLRRCCKASNKIFLKMMRVELLKQKNIDNWEDYLGQVLYDLHGLKLGVGIWDVQDHGCPPEKLEKRNAVALVEKVTLLANRMPIKDLLKSDLKATIEHMQQAVGQTKSTGQMIHNLRNFAEYRKRPIHPLRLYQALSGKVTLDAVTVNAATEAAVAKHGWFFLLGMIALSKFKGVDLNRRQTPGATDDLRIGATFLQLQLQFTPDRWDAWFRLAECFDYELDEAVLWTADKMNKDRAELLKFQRNAIHCYTLALSSSVHSELPVEGSDNDALHDLYNNFAMRLYASSREPFAMDPFKHAEHERFFIESSGNGTFRKILHDEMADYKVWKFAAGLFKKAMVGRPRDWKIPFMLAKCLWKMYQKPAEDLDEKDRASRITAEQVLKALEKTVRVVSLLPKPRSGQDPNLEPHYKIVSVVHKLVSRGDLALQDAVDVLQRQPYAVQNGEPLTLGHKHDWDRFVIRTIRHLRDKDKSNWQHRMIIRHARILYDRDEGAPAEEGQNTADTDPSAEAKAAFVVLRESMFTKTMVMNVWKCDTERPGRHHVYTDRYARYMTRLLSVVNDRANMEALLRRLRKKGVDFYRFPDLWQYCCLAYIRILRRTYDIPPSDEDHFRAVAPEEFEIVSARITEWASHAEGASGGDGSSDDAEPKQPAFAALKEAYELKKLNANLMKVAPVDDLVSDCYWAIYDTIGPQLPGGDPKDVIEARVRAQVEEQAQAAEAANRERLMQLDDATESDSKSASNGQPPTNALSGILNPGVTGGKRERTPLPSLNDTGVASDRERAPAAETSSRHRKPGVRKQDVLRKAEQAILRAAEAPAPKSSGADGESKAAGGTGSGRSERRKSRLGSMSSSKAKSSRGSPNNDEGGEAAAATRVAAAGEQAVVDGDVEMKEADAEPEEEPSIVAMSGHESNSSAPASVHDSADDESDLSDVPEGYDDEPPLSLMFPNLRRSVEASAASGAETGESSAAEEDEEDGGETADDEGEGGDEDEAGPEQDPESHGAENGTDEGETEL